MVLGTTKIQENNEKNIIEKDLNQAEYVIDEPLSIKDGPVKLEIVGDTSHLFADEDFEKKEVYLLHSKSEVNSTKILNSNLNDTHNENSTSKSSPDLPQKSINKSVNPECNGYNTTFRRDLNMVFLINGSTLTHLLSESDVNECFVVLFYVPWCPYSAKLAPYYNALPRAFLNLDFYAFDVSKSIGYNTKFGTSAVPMIIIFQQKLILGKFNYTEKILNDYIEFVANKTGFKENKTIQIEEYDLKGPVPTEPIQVYDYYLLISWLFLVFVSIDFLIRKTKFLSLAFCMFKNLIDFITNRNRQLELPQPPQRAMIQQTADIHTNNNHAANHNTNHLHYD